MWGMIWGRWGDQLETKDTGEEAMERNNWASQNSQRVVELKEGDALIPQIYFWNKNSKYFGNVEFLFQK